MPIPPTRSEISRHGTRHGDVSYVTLALPDAAAGCRFYGAVLGWTFGGDSPHARENQPDDVIPQIGLWPKTEWRGSVTPGAIPSWRVDDIATAVGAIRGLGGTAEEPEKLPYGLQADCSDGKGLRFWIHELPPADVPAGPNGEGHGDISYLVVKVADLAHAQALFSNVLGWNFTSSDAGAHVEGPVPMTGISEGEPGAVLCYRVDDIAATVDALTAAGGTAGPIEERPYGLESHCADDQGLELYLHQLS